MKYFGQGVLFVLYVLLFTVGIWGTRSLVYWREVYVLFAPLPTYIVQGWILYVLFIGLVVWNLRIHHTQISRQIDGLLPRIKVLIFGSILLVGSLVSVTGVLYLIYSLWSKDESIDMSLNFLEAGVVTLGIYFLIKRMEKAEKQVEQQQEANFLSALHQGTTMLYTDDFRKVMGGVSHLSGLGKKKPERRQEIVDLLCSFLRDTKDTELTYRHDVSGMMRDSTEEENTRRIKDKILSLISTYHVTDQIEIDLEGANLQHVRLQDASLQHANFFETKLTGAKLAGTRLQHANLQNVDLQSAELRNAKLQHANLKGADLQDADLDNARMGMTILHGANLQNAWLRDADLHKSSLQGAKLRDAELPYTDLQYANLENTDLRGTDLRGADLRSSYVYESTIFLNTHIDYALISEGSFWEKTCKNKTNSIKKGVYPIICNTDRTFTWRKQNLSRDQLVDELQIHKEEIDTELEKIPEIEHSIDNPIYNDLSSQLMILGNLSARLEDKSVFPDGDY